jgi:hypothetical protein
MSFTEDNLARTRAAQSERQDRMARERVVEVLTEVRRDAQVTHEVFASMHMDREAGDSLALILRVDQLLDLLASGLYARIDRGGPESDAIRRQRAGGLPLRTLLADSPRTTVRPHSLDRRTADVGTVLA